jgi:hypothetical protein
MTEDTDTASDERPASQLAPAKPDPDKSDPRLESTVQEAEHPDPRLWSILEKAELRTKLS